MSDRHLFRKQWSGAAKRKAAKEKDERLSNDLKKAKCITSFFTSPPPAILPGQPTSSISEPGYLSQAANVDDDETAVQHDESDDAVPVPPPSPRSQEIFESEPGEAISESVDTHGHDGPGYSNDVGLWPNIHNMLIHLT